MKTCLMTAHASPATRILKTAATRMFKSSPTLWKSALCVIALGATLSVVAQTNAPAVSCVRSFVNDVPNAPLVTVTISGASNASCFTIEEVLPAPATAREVSGDGVWLPALNAIRWGPYFNTITTNVTYRLTGLPATYPVNGGCWMDGQWFFSPGTTMIAVMPATSPGPMSPPPQATPPIFTPGSGTNVPVEVALFDGTTNATIYYTLDGSLPTTNSMVYTNVIALVSPGVVRAVAFAAGYTPSPASAAFYGPPVLTPNGWITSSVNTNNRAAPLVNLTLVPGTNARCEAVTEFLPVGLTISNISAGGSYAPGNNTIVWGPFFGTNVQNLSYQAAGPSGTYPIQTSLSIDGVSAETNFVVAISPEAAIPTEPPQAATPLFTPSSGSNVPITVTLSDSTPNAVIYYTLDGTLPTQNSILYSGGIVLSSPGMVRAVAFANGYMPSMGSVAFFGPPAASLNAQVNQSVNTDNPAAPVVALDVVPGFGTSCVAVTESLPRGLGAVDISAGGTYIASNNMVVWGPFFGSNAQTLSFHPVGPPGSYPIQAVWSVDGVSAETNFTVTIASGTVIPTPPAQESAPMIFPATSSNLPVTVVITSSDAQAAIYYTTDGTLPTQSATPYTGALTLDSPTTLRARAFRAGYLASTSVVGEYVAPSTMTNSLLLTRSILNNGSFLPTVSLNAAPQGHLSCYTVSETLVPGVTPTAISEGGAWNPDSGTIRWGPYLDSQPRVFCYNILGATGTYPLTAQGSFDGCMTAAQGASAVDINQYYFGASPTNILGCTGQPLVYTIAVNPDPGVVTITSASGTVNWGDGTQSTLTQPVMTFEKQYTAPGAYTVTITANWSGESSSGPVSGYATQLNSIEILTNCDPYPIITAEPSNQTVLAGAAAQFNVTVSSPYPLSFQWYFNSSFPIIGPGISNVLNLPSVGGAETGSYMVVVSNQYGVATSSIATLTVINPLLSGITRNGDGSVSFNVTGLPGSTNVVWATTNLALPASWQPIYTNLDTGPNGVWQFTDADATNFPQRFYRFATP